jgi:hypothetical protein
VRTRGAELTKAKQEVALRKAVEAGGRTRGRRAKLGTENREEDILQTGFRTNYETAILFKNQITPKF